LIFVAIFRSRYISTRNCAEISRDTLAQMYISAVQVSIF